MRALVVVFGIAFGLLAYSWASAYPGEFGTPASPQPIQANGAYSHFDVQVHSRDNFTSWDDPFGAQHTSACGAPPGTHPVQALADSVFVCNDHVMTAGNADGYGEIMLTPSQVVNCAAGCTVQWEMSTERMSVRDWPDVWLTPWADNLALPFDIGDVDLQGVPRRGIHVNAEASQNSWAVSTINNYVETGVSSAWWVGMDEGIAAGTNQSAIRQTFKLTVTPGHVRFERLPSATATGFVWTDANCSCLLASDYVVQFGHHIYNPTKDGAGVPATWHWSNFTLSNATPFTLIHATPKVVVTTNNSLVTFDAPAPANASLRFSGVCQVLIDGQVAPKQRFIGHPEHASSYFIPIAQGKQSVSVSFAPDSWYNGPCAAQDFHIWSKGGPPPSPTPVPSTATPQATSTSTPTSTPTATPQPTATSTLVPSPTATPVPPTATPVPPTATPQPPTPTATPQPTTYTCLVNGVQVWQQTTPRLCN